MSRKQGQWAIAGASLLLVFVTTALLAVHLNDLKAKHRLDDLRTEARKQGIFTEWSERGRILPDQPPEPDSLLSLIQPGGKHYSPLSGTGALAVLSSAAEQDIQQALTARRLPLRREADSPYKVSYADMAYTKGFLRTQNSLALTYAVGGDTRTPFRNLDLARQVMESIPPDSYQMTDAVRVGAYRQLVGTVGKLALQWKDRPSELKRLQGWLIELEVPEPGDSWSTTTMSMTYAIDHPREVSQSGPPLNLPPKTHFEKMAGRIGLNIGPSKDRWGDPVLLRTSVVEATLASRKAWDSAADPLSRFAAMQALLNQQTARPYREAWLAMHHTKQYAGWALMMLMTEAHRAVMLAALELLIRRAEGKPMVLASDSRFTLDPSSGKALSVNADKTQLIVTSLGPDGVPTRLLTSTEGLFRLGGTNWGRLGETEDVVFRAAF